MDPNFEDFQRSHDHRRHCPGAPRAEGWMQCEARVGQELKRAMNPGPARAQTDKAWLVMLLKQGLIGRDAAVTLLKTLRGAESGGEDWLKTQLDGDEDTASLVNLGRTLQEPMSRLQLRAKLLDVLELLLTCLGTLLDVAERNADTVMAGQTHLSHAQPTTYAAYLLSVHDGLVRGLEQLELAYKHTNENTVGCGACSGTGWPVDRHLVTELLGFDRLAELTYDCEPGQDHALTILFALSNIAVLLSRTAMDFNIWAMEEVMMVHVAGPWRGVSSMMPQKAIPGSQFERIRIEATQVISKMVAGVVANKGEPHEDMLPIYMAWRGAVEAMCHAEKAIGFFNGLAPETKPDRQRMLQYAREGYSATPDLAVKLIRDKGVGGRRAHRICATFVRIARERGVQACDATGELLDEAARFVQEEPPGLSTEKVRDALDPVKFLERHTNVGDPAPLESLRLIARRRKALADAAQRHTARLDRIRQAEQRLDAEVAAVLKEE